MSAGKSICVRSSFWSPDLWAIALTSLVLVGCGSGSSDSPGGATAIYGYRIVNTYPHDARAFTQGFAFHDGALIEGTGIRGQSSLRRVELETGKVVELRRLPKELFGEGVAVFGDRIAQLTWQAGRGLVYDLQSLRFKEEFSYRGEGWGLTFDGESLIMSDGSAKLYFLEPDTYQRTGEVEVRDGNQTVHRLNELEFVNGEIWANVWQTERIVRIDPKSGRVTGWIDLSGLKPSGGADVLNGIAYDAGSERLFVTGKLWPHVYEIELAPQ